MCDYSLFGLCAGRASVAQSDGCAKDPIAPRTINTSASQYASSGKFGLDEGGILVFDWGLACISC